MIGDRKEKILAFLSEMTQPVDVEKIRKSCGIGNWNTALKHCLELLIQRKIKGQKTSKSWIFWAYQHINPQPFQEAIGNYEALKINKNEVTLTLSRTPTNMKISFPKNTPEANILTETLQNTPKGTKIGILFTDNPQKPIIIRTFNEATVAHNCGWAPLRLRKSILCVAFKGFRLVALKFALWRVGLRLRGWF